MQELNEHGRWEYSRVDTTEMREEEQSIRDASRSEKVLRGQALLEGSTIRGRKKY